MSEMRRYRGGRPKCQITLREFMRILGELGLSPNWHDDPVTIMGTIGSPQVCNITFDARVMDGRAHTALGGIDVQVDNSGNIVKWDLAVDSYRVDKSAKTLVKGINRVIDGVGRQATIRLNAGVSLEDAQQLMDRFGAFPAVSRETQEVVPDAFVLSRERANVEIDTGLSWAPKITRQVPAVAQLRQDRSGVVEIVVPERAAREMQQVQQALLNTRRAANALSEATTQISQTADKQVSHATVEVKVDSGVISGHSVRWVRDDAAQEAQASQPAAEIAPESAYDLRARTSLDPNARDQLINTITSQARQKQAVTFNA